MTEAPNQLPEPFVPAHVDLRSYSWMPLHGDALLDSNTWTECDPEEKVAALTLWWKSWHQEPAGSLPDNDRVLSNLAGYGVAVKQWQAVRPMAMRNWVLCSDGRYYHRFVAKRVAEAWLQKAIGVWSKEAERLRKENKVREKKQLPPLDISPRPTMQTIGFPPESIPSSTRNGGDFRRKDGEFPAENDPYQPENDPVSGGIPAESDGVSGKPHGGARIPDQTRPDLTGQASSLPVSIETSRERAPAAHGSAAGFQIDDGLIAEAAEVRAAAGLSAVNLRAEAAKYLISEGRKSRKGWLRWAINARAPTGMGPVSPAAADAACGLSAAQPPGTFAIFWAGFPQPDEISRHAEWAARLRSWAESRRGFWSEAFGPKPGEPGCEAPAELARWAIEKRGNPSTRGAAA